MIARMRAETGTHWIRIDVPIARQQIVLRLDQAGTEAPFPKAAAASIGPIYVLGVQLCDALHQLRAARACGRSEQQMDVIRHEAVGRQAARSRHEEPAQVKKI